MVCYSEKVKKGCSYIVGFVSAVLLILGIVTAALGFAQTGEVAAESNEWAGFVKLNAGAFFGWIIGIVGVAVILTSFCGMISCWKRTAWCTVPFIIMTILLGGIAVIAGFLLIGIGSGLVDKMQKDMCAATASSNSRLADEYNKAIQSFVCSEMCPCPAGEGGSTQKLWESYPESLYNQWGITKKSELSQEDKDNGLRKMNWVGGDSPSYSSWKVCYDKVIKPKTSNTEGDENLIQARDFIRKGGLDFLEAYEQEFKCAGACKTALFYATLDISEGKPEIDCVNGLIDDLQGGSQIAGGVAIATAVLLILGGLAAFPLCCGKRDPEKIM